MTFARRVFTLAGVYGLLLMAPLYFLEPQMTAMGQPLSHPETYYGFVGVTLVFQLVFLAIGRDPERYKPLMLVGILEKAVFAGAVAALYFLGRAQGVVTVFAAIDAMLGVLFVVAWRRTQVVPFRRT